MFCGVVFTSDPGKEPVFIEEGGNHTLKWSYKLSAPHSNGGVFDCVEFRRLRFGIEETLAREYGTLVSYVNKVQAKPPANFTILNFTKSDVATYFVVLRFLSVQDVNSPVSVNLHLKGKLRVKEHLLDVFLVKIGILSFLIKPTARLFRIVRIAAL